MVSQLRTPKRLIVTAGLALMMLAIVPSTSALIIDAGEVGDEIKKPNLNINEVCSSPPSNNGNPGTYYSYTCYGVYSRGGYTCAGSVNHQGHYDEDGKPVEDYSTPSDTCVGLIALPEDITLSEQDVQ